jgi:hypothetical protein
MAWIMLMTSSFAKDFVFATLVGIDDFTPQWQNRLGVAEPSTFGTTTCRITFDEVEFALFHFVADAISELAWQATTTERIFSFAKCIFGFACGLAGFCSEQADPFERAAWRSWVLFQVLRRLRRRPS